MSARRLAPVLLAGAASFAAPAAASDFPPASNLAALAGPFALPATGAWAVAPPGEGIHQISLDFVNEWESLGFDAAGNCARPECVRVDGERYRLGFLYRRGFAPGWEWNAELPVIAQGGGFLDPLIERWHKWFALPNNGRERFAHHRYRFTYARGGTTVLDVSEPDNGVGDLRLGVGRSFGRAALRAQFKLPTGDESVLREGNPGGALWLDVALPTGAWRSYASAGLSMNARGAVLSDQQNVLVPFGAFGLTAPVTDALQLHLQLYLHGRLYDDSELRNLYRYGAVLGFGGRYRFSPQWSLDVGMLEDADVNVSPDFDLQFVLTWRQQER